MIVAAGGRDRPRREDRARAERRNGRSAAFGAAFFLFLAALAYPKGMGMGDVKLALLLGAMLGTHGARRADGRHARRARARRSSCSPATAAPPGRWAIPFGPFLALGGVVALFSGDALLDAYLSLF